MVEVRGGRAHPILRSTGESICAGSLSFHREQPLAPRLATPESERSRAVGTNATTHPPLAASGPYLPSLSFAPSARHYLRQEPYAGNPLVRIRAGGTEQSVSLPRHTYQPVRSTVKHPHPGNHPPGGQKRHPQPCRNRHTGRVRNRAPDSTPDSRPEQAAKEPGSGRGSASQTPRDENGSQNGDQRPGSQSLNTIACAFFEASSVSSRFKL